MATAAVNYKSAQEATNLFSLESFTLMGSTKAAASGLARSAEVSNILSGFALLLGSNNTVDDEPLLTGLTGDEDVRALREAFFR